MPSNAKQKTSMLIRGFVPYQEKKREEDMNERQFEHFTSSLNT